MLSKLFKKNPPSAKPAPQPVVTSLEAKRDAAAAAKEVWAAKLETCRGDDAALLALAREAPLVDIKQAAVAALVAEESLRQAENEFRTQNQRVHRLAKQRYQALVAQRESRAQAAQLIAGAAALVREAMVPANRLVELEQAWQALDANLLTEELRAEYAGLAAQLSAQLRERGEQRQAFGRWLAKTKETLQQLTAICRAVAAGTAPESELVTPVAALQAALAEQPPHETAKAGEEAGRLADACRAALQVAADLPAQLLEQAAQEAARQQAAAEAAAEAAARQSAAAAAPAKKGRTKIALPADFAGQVQAAETALAGGHLADARKHLLAIDQALGDDKSKMALSPSLDARIEAVQAEYARLKGWQHWGGGRVREDLVDEAEALARTVGQADEAAATKVNPKQCADAIEQLRQRWKDLDRLGGAGGKALWPRFDAALKAAYVPVAAMQAKLKAARDENLAARRRLIAELNALPVEAAADGTAPDWRELARALDHFEGEWRKLGPVEHTVPHKARDALLEQRAAAIARIESPLHDARAVAQGRREKLVARAAALTTGTPPRDSLVKVRELQAEWQQQARELPLARGVERALWTEFKAATDAVFTRRDAEVSARDAEFKAHQAAREALIERLGGLNEATPPAEIERAVASIDREWRAAGAVANNHAGRLDERFAAARAGALQLITGAKQRAWQATCDALLAKLALCEKLEAADASSAAEFGESADFDAAWPVQPAVPQGWKDSLAARFKAGLARLADGGAPVADSASVEPVGDVVLLRLEAGLDIPSPPEFQAARRELKLLAMKKAMESRQAAGAPADDVASLLIDALGRRPTASQRDRLRTIIAALRARPAG